MTLQQSDIQKRKEQHFVECAARLLDIEWQAEMREGPDFIVSCCGESFALEVTEIQSGLHNRKGSKEKKAEAANTEWLKSIRVDFDPNSDLPLDLKFLGSATEANRNFILAALRTERFEQRPVLHQMVVELDDGDKLWATKALGHYWQFMRDTVGWVSQNSANLHDALAKKSQKIETYRKAHSDVRLLVVADRSVNSGKILLNNGVRADLGGFNAVYFLSYPTEAFEVHSF